MTQKLYEVDVLDHVEIRLSDGKKLSAKMWMPRPTEVVMEGAAEAFPVVLEAIPYRKDDVCLIDDAVRFGYVSDDLVPAAYDLEVLIVDVLYVAGPLIASVLLAICNAGATLGVVYALMAVGCAMWRRARLCARMPPKCVLCGGLRKVEANRRCCRISILFCCC